MRWEATREIVLSSVTWSGRLASLADFCEDLLLGQTTVDVNTVDQSHALSSAPGNGGSYIEIVK